MNGLAGGVTEVTRSTVPPPLMTSTSCVTEIPTGTSVRPWSGANGNASVPGTAYRPGLAPVPVTGTRRSRPVLVVNDTVPSAVPGAAGENFTSACSLAPVASLTGSVTGRGLPPAEVSVSWPTVNWLAGARELDAPVLAATWVMVTGFFAVMETSLLVVALTLVCGTVVAAACTGGADGGA